MNVFSGDVAIGQPMRLCVHGQSVEHVVKFDDGTEVRVALPPGGVLTIKRGHLVSFNVECHVLAADDVGPRLVSEESAPAEG